MARTRIAPRETSFDRPAATLMPRPSSSALERKGGNPRLYYDLAAVALCAAGLLLGIGLLKRGATGPVGRFFELATRLFTGHVVYLMPVLLLAAGVALAADYRRTTRLNTLLGAGGLLVVLFGWLHLAGTPSTGYFTTTIARAAAIFGHRADLAVLHRPDGGLMGALVATLLSPLDVVGSYVVLTALGLGSLLLLTEVSLATAAGRAKDHSQRVAAVAAEPIRTFRETRQSRRPGLFLDVNESAATEVLPEPRLGRRRIPKQAEEPEMPPASLLPASVLPAAVPEPLAADLAPAAEKPRRKLPGLPRLGAAPAARDGEYLLPKLELLDAAKARPARSQGDQQQNIATLENTLAQFRIEAQVVEIADGPSVTRYEIRLGEGIRVKKILDLADNLAMSLAAMSVRVEAPIPGKSAIGIEVPKKQPMVVSLRECLETDEFQKHPSLLAFALGKDVAGDPQYADLARMPHLLVAGATNSGKSVCLNVLIASLVYRARPEDLKLIMIDPKRVELTLFEGIPHLIHPVIKDVKQAAGILRWVLKEMERRYDLFAQVMTRNLEGYNSKVGDHPDKRLPFIVVIIDELADLMMQQGPEVEQSICRLAQLARATGIHLVIATQRPSVDVITGLIKANVPSRIAFSVSSQIDSRTILDGKGAENLIGRGDMLFKPIDAIKPLRVQGAFLSEAEVNRIVEHLKQQGPPAYIAEPISVDSAATGGRSESEEDAEDDLFEPAARFIVTTGHASTSMIQRKFKIGYTRAARLVDMMETRGIVGSLDGAKPREILMSVSRLDEMFRNQREALFNPGVGGYDEPEDDDAFGEE